MSPEHVQALNTIDLEFKSEKYLEVRTKWKIYLDHLSSFPQEDVTKQEIWEGKRIDLLASLLMVMGGTLGYDFDEVHIKKGFYSPEAHSRIEFEQTMLRRGLLSFVYGNTPIKMDITSVPENKESLKEQEILRKSLIALLEGEKGLNVITAKKPPPKKED